MSEKKFLDRDLTRRQFLKLSGKSLAGLALSSTLLQLCGTTQAEVDSGAVSTWALPQGLLVVNAAKCTGCQRCEINCTLVNDGEVSSYMSRVKMTRKLFLADDGQSGLHSWNYRYYADTCKQCKDPACGNACPVGAIYADETTGIRKVNEDKCVGCGLCAQACPWHMPTIHPEKKKSTKCIACGACAAGCIAGALQIIPWEDVAAAV